MNNPSRRHRGPRRPQNNNQAGPRPQQQSSRPRPQGSAQGASQGSGSQQGSAGSAESRNQSFRRSRRRRSGRPLSPAQVVQKYLNLLEQHLTNRRKYWEDFDRDDGRHRKKLERNFFASIEQLRRFEEKLDGRQRAALLQHVERYNPDSTYSKNHELPFEAEKVSFEGEFEDPHFTEEQIEAFKAYAQDREETMGTMDDYVAYKAEKK
ncbi:MAG: hypothetical protein LW878_12740 [Proteobacteria bacterium]|nr:hypothetical protein [Pseudomonadota bacterium]